MKVANVAELKSRLREYLNFVEQGEEVEVRKRNVPVARIVPLRRKQPNRTQLGCGLGSVEILSDLTEPMIPSTEWEMLSTDSHGPRKVLTTPELRLKGSGKGAN